MASKGRLRAGCFQALRRVEKPEDQGQFGRYSPVQYLKKGTWYSNADSMQKNNICNAHIMHTMYKLYAHYVQTM